MVNSIKCRKCQNYGNISEIKLRSLPDGTSKFLCSKCYNQLSKQKKIIKICPHCNYPIYFDAKNCPYCGKPLKNILKQNIETHRCKTCGTKNPVQRATCKTCGTKLVSKKQKIEIENPELKQKTKKYTIGLIGSIIIFSILIGIFAYTTSVEDSENIFDSYNPDAKFRLHTYEMIDSNGYASMKLIFDTNSDLTIEIYDQNGRTLSTKDIIHNEKIKTFEIGQRYKTFDKNSKFLIIAKTGSHTIFKQTKYFSGPKITFNEIETEWTHYSTLHTDKLEILKITVENNGDLPIYLDSIELEVDLRYGPYSLPIDHKPIAVNPGEKTTFETYIDIENEIWTNNEHRLDIELYDFNRNLVETHYCYQKP